MPYAHTTHLVNSKIMHIVLAQIFATANFNLVAQGTEWRKYEGCYHKLEKDGWSAAQ